MLPLRTTLFCILLALAGCAARPPATVATVPPAPLSPAPPSPPPSPGPQHAPPLRGTILAMRPVPVQAIGPVRMLAADLGVAGDPGDPRLFEFIVRTSSGTTIAVVQPGSGGLRPGDAVDLLPGTPARIDPLPAGR